MDASTPIASQYAGTNGSPATPQLFVCGDWVRIVPSQGLFGQIVELRGPLGPNGAQVYRVKIKATVRKPVYTEVWESQIEKVPAPAK